ncbi:MAG: hypothetical protein Pg6C_05020 [Treponemataceae bacterium]|nr:MAG: hypothetical protein Pg6C_05020 [Treponemataceae bacterium]
MIPKILNVEAVEGYKIKINYETGEIKMFDVLPYITGSWYKELYDYSYFKRRSTILSATE